MKKFISIVLVISFSFLNAFPFIGCSSAEAEQPKEVRACWVSSIGNLDFPGKMGLSKKQLQAEMDAIIENCRNMGLNTIFFQVRPTGDSLYESNVFPLSKYLSGKQGVAPAGNFDPLTYFISKAHKAGISLHAWINPYRIGTGENVIRELSADNPAVIHPEYTIQSKSGLYYNPGLPEARNLILDGVAELVRNYDIDGIHFDDYFYPYNMEGFDDSESYRLYGQGMSLADYRRASVDELVRSAYQLIKSLNEDVQFGISPFGIWANESTKAGGSKTSGMSSYAAIYSDSKKWVEQGWLDYICPQIYWSFDHEAAPYGVLVDWWSDVCARSKVDLYIGLAAYKVDTEEIGWKESDLIYRQLQYASGKKGYAGHCFFRYGVLVDNPLNLRGMIRKYYNGGQSQEVAAVVKPITLKPAGTLMVNSPASGTVVEASGISVSGVTAPGKSVQVNGISAVVSPKGFYAAYIPLKVGSNIITVRSNGGSKSIWVTRKQSNAELKTLNIDSAYPNGEVHRNSGDLLSFSVNAPKGWSVQLTNGTLTIPLVPTGDGRVYQASWVVPAFPAGDKLLLDGFEYVVTDSKNKQMRIQTDLQLNLYADEFSKEQYLQKNAYLFDGSRGGSQMDHQPLPKGTKVRIIGIEGSRGLLENGYWVEREALGDEPIIADNPSAYNYEKVEISGDLPLLFAPDGAEDQLLLQVDAARNIPLKIKCNNAKIGMEREFLDSYGVLRFSSKNGGKLAGYEIFPHKDGVTVYLRFHSEGLRGKKILLDAGHGGIDSGALGPGGSKYPAESELNLILAEYVRQELVRAGANVCMTRAEDTALTLEQRVEKSRVEAPDIFLSIHHNSTEQTANFNAVSGGLTLYSSPLAEGLTQKIAENLWDGVGEKAGSTYRKQSLHVCRQTRCPAVLVEAGYLCNPLEYERLCQEGVARKIAKNIVLGLEDYFVTVCS
ncbi:MAG: family 10 glycosylhydrolase [Clostridia bacterium]|nr:family 10 glycosylhydrolase [Clostridia bacterium]